MDYPVRDDWRGVELMTAGLQGTVTITVIQIVGGAIARYDLDHVKAAIEAVFVNGGIVTLDDLDLRFQSLIDQARGRGWCRFRQRWWRHLGQRLQVTGCCRLGGQQG